MVDEHIKQKSENALNISIKYIEKLINGEYNQVYKITTIDEDKYIVRILRNKYWPEDGKLEWISKVLTENNIPAAKIVYYTKEDSDFDNGFMIQEFIDGDNVEDVIGTRINYDEFYKELGKIMSKVHNIKLPKFGYIGKGEGNHESLLSFIERDLPRFFKRVESLKIFSEDEQSDLIRKIVNNLKSLSNLPSVLCHNDLSPNNAMLSKEGKLVLIDWDNAISSCWVNDFSVMTYWMRFRHKDETAKFREIFLENYKTDFEVENLDKLEKTFHIVQGINLLGYYYFEQDHKSAYEKTLSYIKELINLI